MNDEKPDNEAVFIPRIVLHGRTEIEKSADSAIQAIYLEAWTLINAVKNALELGELADEKGSYNKGIYRLEHKSADFNLDTGRKKRFSFVVFNAYPTIVLNPTIAAVSQAESYQTVLELVRLVGEHDQSFWNRVASMSID